MWRYKVGEQNRGCCHHDIIPGDLQSIKTNAIQNYKKFIYPANKE